MSGRIVRSVFTGLAVAAILCVAAPPRAEAASWRWQESNAPGSSFLAAARQQAVALWQWVEERVSSATLHGTWQKNGAPASAAAPANAGLAPPDPAPTGDQGPMIDPNGVPHH